MIQKGTDMIGLGEAKGYLRRKRALLNRAYRAAKRQGQREYTQGKGDGGSANFLKAAHIMTSAEQEGLKIGTIQRSDQLDALGTQAHKHAEMAGAAMEKYFQPQPKEEVETPSNKPLSVDEDDEYYDHFLHNMALFDRK